MADVRVAGWRTRNRAKRRFHYRPIYDTLLKWIIYFRQVVKPPARVCVCVWRRCVKRLTGRGDSGQSGIVLHMPNTTDSIEAATHTHTPSESHEIFDSFLFSFAVVSMFSRNRQRFAASRTWQIRILLSFQIFSTHFCFLFFSPALKVSIFDNAPAQFASNGIGGNEKHASLRTSFSQESNVRKYATEITVAAVGCLCHLRHPYKRHHRLRHNKTSTPSFSTFEFIHFGPARTPAFAVIRDGMWYAFSFEAHNITSRYNVVLHVLR